MPLTQEWDRESLEALPADERPLVRCSIDVAGGDGLTKSFMGRIVVDGNNPWLVGRVGKREREFRLSWGLVCQVLNDPLASPVNFSGQEA